MSLNSIVFSSKSLADLYKTHLVDLPAYRDKTPETVTEMRGKWKFLGENKRQILIVVKESEAVHIADQSLQFLIALLKACRLGLSDVAVFNFYPLAVQEPSAEERSAYFKDLLSFFKPEKVFLFGVTPEEFGMPLRFPALQIQPFNEVIYLSAPSLPETEPDNVLKSKLWVCLKKIFNL
jgi:hypothetical protein